MFNAQHVWFGVQYLKLNHIYNILYKILDLVFNNQYLTLQQ